MTPRPPRRWMFPVQVVTPALPAVLLPACGQALQSSLAPVSQDAGRIASLWWTMFWIGSGVYLLVLGALLVAIRRSRKRPEAAKAPPTYLIWAGGVFLPVTVIVVLAFLTFSTTAATAPSRWEGEVDLRIEVTGHRFWWEVRYPDEGIVTANEITIPAGRRVEFVLTSADVIHSFWVPRLHGKVDMTPGHTTRLQVQADRAGVFRGQCAEYCGTQHANMAFFVEALNPEDFEEWVEQRLEPAGPIGPQAQRGKEVFLSVGCAGCHAIGGTEARGTLGPDLTHLMTRRTLAAGTVPNHKGYRGGWIVDPQPIKPGNLMPPTALEAQDLIDLLEYLETLR